MAGGREGKGGRSGSGGEINPREKKARRGGRKRMGRGERCRAWRAPKSQGQGFHDGGQLWKPLVEGLLVALARLGVSLSVVGVCVWEHLHSACILMASAFGLVRA